MAGLGKEEFIEWEKRLYCTRNPIERKGYAGTSSVYAPHTMEEEVIKHPKAAVLLQAQPRQRRRLAVTFHAQCEGVILYVDMKGRGDTPTHNQA